MAVAVPLLMKSATEQLYYDNIVAYVSMYGKQFSSSTSDMNFVNVEIQTKLGGFTPAEFTPNFSWKVIENADKNAQKWFKETVHVLPLRPLVLPILKQLAFI